MADSRTELLLQAVVAALDGAGKPPDATVNRNRRQQIQRDDMPCISVERLDEGVSQPGGRLARLAERRLRIAVVSRVGGDDAALDPFSQLALAALLADPSLGGLAVAIEEQSVDWEYDEDWATDYSVEARIFEIRYTTHASDLTL